MSRTEIDVRVMGPADAHLLERVDDDVFDHTVQPALVQAFLANPGNLLAVALDAGMTIGMASGIAYVHPDKPLQLFVNEVGVSARYQRQGVGARLVRALLGRGRDLGCTEAWVLTEEGNGPARALYASVGGVEIGERAVAYEFPLTGMTRFEDPTADA